MDTAQALNTVLDNSQDDGDQFLTFILDGEEYGIDILRVQEIRGWTRTTPIPNAPPYLKGVINLRGIIVPILDLRERFGMQALEYGPTTVVIVVRTAGEDRDRIIGIVVDAVSEVYSFSGDDRQAPPDMGDMVQERFLQGLATVDEKMIVLLDIDHLLDAGSLPTGQAL